jgi:dTDP-glucose 4,6-dehydratase
MRLLVTGGAGFIGSHFVDYRLKNYPDMPIVVVDKLTYAGNLTNLEQASKNKKFKFFQSDICNEPMINRIIRSQGINAIVNFAAETHVDRSLIFPGDFIRSNILGAQVLLEVAKNFAISRFLQVSTDEVYGSIISGKVTENARLNPSSPYSVSKAGADMLALSYSRIYDMPIVITRSSNNYGPRQYPEKLIPKFVTRLIKGFKVPIYGKGLQRRDWIYVEDNCRALDMVLINGKPGQIYNVGYGETHTNLEVAKLLLQELGSDEKKLQFIQQRQGEDQRYSLDTTKIRSLGWKPEHLFKESIKSTIDWYKNKLTN